MRVSDPAILSRHFLHRPICQENEGLYILQEGFFCDEHGTRRLTPPTPNLGIARGLSGYRQIPLPQQFSQSKNSSLRRACAFCEVSRDYCILLPFPFPAPPPRDIVAISATYGPFLAHDHRDIWGRCSSEQRGARLARSRSKLCRYPRQRNKPRDAPTREYICSAE